MITTSHSKPFEYIEWAEEFSQKKRRRHELEQEKNDGQNRQCNGYKSALTPVNMIL